MMDFLPHTEWRPLTLPEDIPLKPLGLALGKGSLALEVALVEARDKPTRGSMRRAWKARRGRRATPVLLVALYGEKAGICGPTGESPPIRRDLDKAQVSKICEVALEQPDRHAALRFLHRVMPDEDAPLPGGIRNQGLLATHELASGVPKRQDWATATEKAQSVLDKRGDDLLQALGFEVIQLPGPVSILAAQDTKVAVALCLGRSEAVSLANERFSGASPVAYALARADRENLPYVLISIDGELRLHPAEAEVAVGQGGRTETFVQVDLNLLTSSQAGYLWLLFSADALSAGGTLEEILERSADYAADLGTRLRERVYTDVVPDLAEAIARARHLRSPDAKQLETTYQMALTLLFRLLFVAYAEDQGFLPCRSNDLYRSRSLKQKAHELLELRERNQEYTPGTSQWDDVERLFKAIDQGKDEWGVPQYNGGLFSRNPAVSELGAALDEISLDDTVFGPVLAALLLDESPEGVGPVDFRSLGVREFGTIYEGLLESELSIARSDLTVDEEGFYVPTEEPEQVEVQAGEVYLHNASGKRKATGSYYTKTFAVEHLLNHALKPALEQHLRRLDEMHDQAAGEVFFDFRVADIAMGSGHFLVAAVDHIEREFSNYLAERPLPAVTDELERLRARASKAVQNLGGSLEVDDTQLLRRQIARRCIYGVDVKSVAVELARLSLWIHTFVPGLPLSLLDYNLVQGNSLVGIATLDEAAELMEAGKKGTLFSFSAKKILGDAAENLERFGRIADADAAELSRARKEREEAQDSLKPAEALLDILAASRLNEDLQQRIANGEAVNWAANMSELPGSDTHEAALETLEAIPPFHFPIAFPQVFLRERPGLDVVVGNPPWEEVKAEEYGFWHRYFPGIRGLSHREQLKQVAKLRNQRPDLVARFEAEEAATEALHRVLAASGYPGMEAGDPDLYKAFVWRFWHLTTDDGGRIGVVLPRASMMTKGTEDFRKTILRRGTVLDLTLILNNRNWFFEDVHPQYTVALLAVEKAPAGENASLPIRGPFRSRGGFEIGVQEPPVHFPAEGIFEWTDTAALPLLPTEGSAEVFAQLREAPRLCLDREASWRARPYRELDATNDKDVMEFLEECPDAYWPVYKGASFDIWNPDTGTYYAWANPELVKEHLQAKRERASHYSRSAFYEFESDWIEDETTLPCRHTRVAFRNVTNRTNRRTVIVALLPPKVFLTNAAPHLLWPRGDEKDQAYLLGILSSIPLDWYARRFVEVNLNYHVFNPFPVPRPERDNPLWQRAVELAGRLACPDDRFEKWAEAVGVDCGPLEPNEKKQMIHELDAVVAHLYGLSESHVRQIFETFHEGWDYGRRLEATLIHYHNWEEQL